MTIWIIATRANDEIPFTFRLLPGSVKTLGRAARADFVIEAGMVSRVHCQLSAGTAEVEVIDLDSTNGTYVNGQRVARALLKDGDELGIGRVTFKVSRSDT